MLTDLTCSAGPAPRRDAATLEAAQRVVTRLCHDLAGLAGTIQTALGMVGGAGAAEAAEIARETARLLARRIEVARAAWGEGGATIDRPLGEMLEGVPGGDRLRLSGGEELAPEQACLNLIVIAAACLKGRATAHFTSHSGAYTVRIEGDVDRDRLSQAADPRAALALLDEHRTVWLGLSALMLAALSYRLEIEPGGLLVCRRSENAKEAVAEPAGLLVRLDDRVAGGHRVA